MKLEQNIIRGNNNNEQQTTFKYIINVTILDYGSFVALLSNITANWMTLPIFLFCLLSASLDDGLWIDMVFQVINAFGDNSCHKMVEMIEWLNRKMLLFSCDCISLIYNLRESLQPAGKNKNTQ